MSRLRNTPCTECRKHRRKCIQTTTTKCSRCERLGKICFQQTKDIASYAEGNDMFDDLKVEASQLELAIKQLEIQMQDLSYRSNSNNSSSCSSITNTSISSSNSSTTSNSMIYQNTINYQPQTHQWKIHLKNGTFQIETGIKNISDLLRFQSNDIHYLSPFSSGLSTFSGLDSLYGDDSDYRGGDNGLIIQFGSENMIPFTIKILTESAKKDFHRPRTILLPRILHFNPSAVIDQLIHLFFSCHNLYKATLHQSSFMKTYKQLDDPMTDLLSLSVCVYVCSSPCDHLYYTPFERRHLADYFFECAKSIIFEQFDLPEKRLENIIAINLLTKYMHMTLKYNQCKKLCSIAYQICLDIRNHPPAILETLFEDEIFRVLYSRHATVTTRTQRLMDYLSNQSSSFFYLPKWISMPDEPEETKRFIMVQNWILDLYNHPFIDNFTKQIEKIHLGQAFTLSFESIIRLEDVVSEWSNSIPNEFNEFNECISLKDFDLCKAAIDNITDVNVLMAFILFQSFMIGVHSCLLQPISLGTDNNQLLSFVQQRSLDTSLKGCRLLIHAILRISQTKGTTLCYYTLAASDYLFNAIDILLVLSLSHNPYIAKESRFILNYCLETVENIKFMKDHQAPNNTSPMFSGLMDYKDETTFNFEYYDKFPQPWIAMMYDFSKYITSLE